VLESIPIEFQLECLVLSVRGPLKKRDAARALGELSDHELTEVVSKLNQRNIQEGRSYTVEERGDCLVARTRDTCAPLIQALKEERKPLSQSLLQTLAVVAYRQPVTRAAIEKLRGVDCGYAISRLHDLGLIRISGRAQKPGRPLLYKTTETFLIRLGLPSLESLPKIDELREITIAAQSESVATTPHPELDLVVEEV
jgi:segregation and condensation protein B